MIQSNLINIDDTTIDSITNETIETHANKIIDAIVNGEIDPLKLAVQIKYFEDVIDKIKDTLKSEVITELNKYSRNEAITKFSSEFKVKEYGTKYDYSNCNDDNWNNCNELIAHTSKLKKDREAFLKTIKESITTVDPQTGEVKTLFAPIKTSTTSYSITWHKK
jgi:hypothetical protein